MDIVKLFHTEGTLVDGVGCDHGHFYRVGYTRVADPIGTISRYLFLSGEYHWKGWRECRPLCLVAIGIKQALYCICNRWCDLFIYGVYLCEHLDVYG